MPGLGLGLSGLSEALGSGTTAVIIEDYFWEIHTTAGAGYLTPIELGDVADFHDTWDLITISTTGHYQPQTVVTVSDEGYWDVHTISSGNDAIKPLNV